MNPTDPVSSTRATLKALAPWAVFTAFLAVGVVCFFRYADRVPSLLQALAER